ncbi:MAG: hypothetical protein ACI4DQ_08250 [Lachnospiraceae bacterium]
MRITNKIMQNNSLTNINTNKLLQDQLSSQMATEKKVNRPSDDPVVAIRALRLRTNVNQITQYYEKNAPDAESWLSLTGDAISSMTEVVNKMIENATRGSNGELKTEDRETILTALKSLRDEVYSTGNTDYAGRYIFTGYRTDSSLTYKQDTTERFSITEQFDSSRLDNVGYVETDDLLEINEANFNNYNTINENNITNSEVHRLRLSYKDIADKNGAQDTLPEIQTYNAGTGNFEKLDQITVNGNPTAVTYESISLYDDPSPYAEIQGKANGIILVKETGELLLGENVYNHLMGLNDDPATSNVNEGEIRVTYQKENWNEGDLRPEHYFACTKMNVPNVGDINYNQSYLDGIQEKQAIEYDVGLNQRIRVNTTADEIFKHEIGRDVDDMIATMEETLKLEQLVAKLDGILKEEKFVNDPNADVIRATLQQQLDAANKALTFSKDKTQKMYEGCITKMQGHLDTVNLASTQNGTRRQRLELVTNRMMSQKTNFETLKSENEDADITEVAIKLSSAELTYNASLMATGKIMKNSLMNFI